MMEQEDGGGGITALAKCPGYILIFKRRSLKRWDGSSTYPDDMVRQGTPSQECICYSRGMVAFLNENGIWATVGGMPKLLSDKRVDDFISAITDFTKVHSGATERNIYFAIGDVTVDEITYNNVLLKYNIDYQTWDIRSYAAEIRAISNYVDANGKACLIGGDNDGNIFQLDSGTTDMGTPIFWTVETHNFEFGSRAYRKRVGERIIHTEGINEGTIFSRVNSKSEKSWNPVGNITGDISRIRGTKDEGNWFNYKIAGSSEKGDAKFLGLEFPDKSIEVLENINA